MSSSWVSESSQCSSPSLSPSPSQSKSETEEMMTPHHSASRANSRRTTTSTRSRSERIPHGGGPSRQTSSLEQPEIPPLPLQPPALAPLPQQQQLHYQTFQDIPAPSVDGPSDDEGEFSEISDWSWTIKVFFGLVAVMIVIWMAVQIIPASTVWLS